MKRQMAIAAIAAIAFAAILFPATLGAVENSAPAVLPDSLLWEFVTAPGYEWMSVCKSGGMVTARQQDKPADQEAHAAHHPGAGGTVPATPILASPDINLSDLLTFLGALDTMKISMDPAVVQQ